MRRFRLRQEQDFLSDSFNIRELLHCTLQLSKKYFVVRDGVLRQSQVNLFVAGALVSVQSQRGDPDLLQ